MNKNNDKMFLLIGVLYPIVVTLFSNWNPVAVAIPFVAAAVWAGSRIGGRRGCLFIGIMCIEIAFILVVFFGFFLPPRHPPSLRGITG